MNKIKRIIAPIVAAVLLLSICSLTSCGMFNKDGIDLKKEEKSHEAFIKELGGVSDTYVGAVSDNTYNTVSDAAAAYIDDQIVGYSYYSIVNTTEGVELTTDEIRALQLSNEDTRGMISVETVDVTISGSDSYSMKNTNSSGIASLATLNNERTVKVYIIKYDNGFKYFSPCPITGETITRSYYDSVFNSDKYVNCTYTTTSTVEEEISVIAFLKIKVTVETSQIIRFTEDAIYIEQKTKASPSIFGENTEICAYVFEDEYGSMECYVSEDGEEWNPGSLSTVGFSSLEDLTPFKDQYLDYSYFNKTDYGFELAEENSKKYVDQTLSSLDTSMFDELTMDMFAKYYVCEGTLSGMRTEVFLDSSVSTGEEDQELSIKAYAVNEMKITDCGTTVVERPF